MEEGNIACFWLSVASAPESEMGELNHCSHSRSTGLEVWQDYLDSALTGHNHHLCSNPLGSSMQDPISPNCVNPPITLVLYP